MMSHFYAQTGLPWWRTGKESICQCRYTGSIPPCPYALEELSRCTTTIQPTCPRASAPQEKPLQWEASAHPNKRKPLSSNKNPAQPKTNYRKKQTNTFMPKLRTPSPRLLFCCIPQTSKAWLAQFHNQRKSRKSATETKTSWLNRWRTLPVSSKVLEQHPIVCSAGAGRQDGHVGRFHCWGLGEVRITNCMGTDLSRSLSGRYPSGECLAGYSQRLGHGWTRMCAGTQARMHLGTQTCSHTPMHAPMLPDTHAGTYIAMHPRMHSGTHTHTHTHTHICRGLRMRTPLTHAGVRAPHMHAHARTHGRRTEVRHCADTADRGNQLSGWLLLRSLVSYRYLGRGARRWEGQSCK